MPLKRESRIQNVELIYTNSNFKQIFGTSAKKVKFHVVMFRPSVAQIILVASKIRHIYSSQVILVNKKVLPPTHNTLR
jgi:hypothetical protein